MAHDVFISYAKADRAAAEAVRGALEAGHVRCWMAPRDILPGEGWGGAIVRAIAGAEAVVLVFSEHANASPQILREVERAVDKGVRIIPVRIADVLPSDDLAYFISSQHWLDALPPPLEQHLRRIAEAIQHALVTVDRTESPPKPPRGASPAARRASQPRQEPRQKSSAAGAKPQRERPPANEAPPERPPPRKKPLAAEATPRQEGPPQQRRSSGATTEAEDEARGGVRQGDQVLLSTLLAIGLSVGVWALWDFFQSPSLEWPKRCEGLPALSTEFDPSTAFLQRTREGDAADFYAVTLAEPARLVVTMWGYEFEPKVWLAQMPGRSGVASTATVGASLEAGCHVVAAGGGSAGNGDRYSLNAEVRPFLAGTDVWIEQVRFYETGRDNLPLPEREYRRSFRAASTRFIGIELNLRRERSGAEVEAPITCTLSDPRGAERRLELKPKLNANGTNWYWSAGWGQNFLGWASGFHSVECTTQGLTVATGTFKVEGAAEDP